MMISHPRVCEQPGIRLPPHFAVEGITQQNHGRRGKFPSGSRRISNWRAPSGGINRPLIGLASNE